MNAIFDLCYVTAVWSGPSMYCSEIAQCRLHVILDFLKFVFNIVPIIRMDVSIIKSHFSEWVGWCMSDLARKWA